MFTGITTDVGTVAKAEQRANADLRLTIHCAYDLTTVDLGASIACSGVCFTVVDKGDDWFAVDVSAETLSKTAGQLWEQGAKLNLERSLRIGDELGGHIVSGHVDGIAEVISVRPEAGSLRVDLRVTASLGPFLAPKGSITLDGVSLTVNTVTDFADGTEFSVNIIPHTAERTTFGKIEPGRQFNVEIDVIARYLQRLIANNAQGRHRVDP
jgi:riboflavin synthase